MFSRHLSRGLLSLASLLVAFVTAPVASGQWVDFADETSTRLIAASGLGSGDVQEKDYAWADIDQDGDIDLVVVRKQPFTSTGRFPNVLFMNENGVLTDRTAQYASASSVAGSQGFLDATNDRDVAFADLNGDGWLDMITAVTLSGTQPKYISHPRVYINLGDDGLGNWQGFIFDDENRTPTMPAEPRFCSVSVGDIDGDGDVDFYMGDYQQGGARAVDLQDRLFINDGTGYFSDESSARMSATMLESSFAMSTQIVDMNGDGKLDIIKDDALNAPQGISISYNNTSSEGFFGSYEFAYNFTPYHVAIGDLNNDGLPDLVASDDGSDRYILNQGNGGDGLADFGPAQTFSFSGGGSDDGFAGNNLIVDLNNDGWNDVVITDVDVDISGCNRRANIYRNLGNAPNVTLQEELIGGAVCGIPTSMLVGSHDVAAFDINGDGWKDLVLGRCTGTQVWMNQPPLGIVFSYPQGLPYFAAPNSNLTFQVEATGIGGTTPDPSTARLFTSVNGAPFSSASMTHLGGTLYEASTTVPANCTDDLSFYVSIADTAGIFRTDPASAPGFTYSVIAASGTTISFEDDMEGNVSGWTVVNSTALSTGGWEVAIPIGTLSGGNPSAPGEDAEAGTNKVRCWVTQNGVVGGSVGAADVDGGPTDLISPAIDLAGTDGTVSYSRWFFNDDNDGDALEVAVSGNGVTWVNVESTTGLANEWTVASFRVGDYITPTAGVQVRFRASDNPNNSITEAGIDLFRVEKFVCEVCQTNIGFQGPGPLDLQICGGDLSQGTSANIYIKQGFPNDLVYLYVDLAVNPAPVLSGISITTAPALIYPVVTDINGEWVSASIPGGIGNYTYYLQAAEFRNDVPGGLAFSNAVQLNFLQ